MKFHFALLCVLCAHAIAQDENNVELKAAATPVAASWNNEVLFTVLKSALFGKCITAANTTKMQYFYIKNAEQGIEFVRYELHKFEYSLTPVNWTKEIQCQDILDCSKASKDHYMFQYSGTTCRMAKVTYTNNLGWFRFDYEGYTNDVVYLNKAVTPTGCPATTDVIDTGSGPMCVGGTNQKVPFPKEYSTYSCDLHYGGWLYYEDSNALDFTTLRNHMRNKNYQGEFVISAWYDDSNSLIYKWDYGHGKTVNTSYFAVKPLEPSYQRLVAISSSHDYLLVALNDTNLVTGFLCVGHPLG